MRCDVNISVRPKGSRELGVRTEIKNMNSISNIIRAMEFEYKRQCELLDSGEEVVQETLRFDDKTGTTSPMRSKEDAKDYRFFPEPDVMGVKLCDEDVESIKQSLPELADSRFERYVKDLGINESDAELLSRYRAVADFFEQTTSCVCDARLVSKFILGQIFASLASEDDKDVFQIGITPAQLGDLLKLVKQGKISTGFAKLTLDKMLANSRPYTDFLSDEDMGGMGEEELLTLCKKALRECEAAVCDYRAGKEKALKAILGFVMRESRGKADAKLAQETLIKLL